MPLRARVRCKRSRGIAVRYPRQRRCSGRQSFYALADTLMWMLEPGAVKFFKAVGGFTVKIGNAAGVDAQLDGTSLGVLGANGKVVELNLPKGYVPPSKP